MLVNAAQGWALPSRRARWCRTATCSIARLREGIGARQKYHALNCAHGRRAFSRALFGAPCLDAEQIAELAFLMRKCEEFVGGPTEIEWARDDAGIKLLQARPLAVAAAPVPDEIWLKHPG